MKQEVKHQYVKRTQKDYTMSFKLSVVQEVEKGSISIGEARKNMAFNLMGQYRIGLRNLVTVILYQTCKLFSGRHIALLADLMGHESIETTRIYLRRTALEQQNIEDRVVVW